MKSTGSVVGKELKSLINMVSKSKPFVPLLFAVGGLGRLTQFNLADSSDGVVPPDPKIDLPEENYPKDIEKVD